MGDDALAKLAALRKDIVHNNADIKELYNELDKVVIEFEQKIKRLEVITKHEASDYPSVLESIDILLQSRPTED